MSASVDDRVVGMKFDNGTFESAVKTTIGTLARLKESLSFKGSDKGINDLQSSANRFSLSGMSGATSGISKSFLAMSTVAITALANITNKAVDAGLNLAKSLTIAPIMDGFKEYETNLNSVQTILANTGLKGQSGLDKVNGALNDLNHYSDKTIYNFSEMARNIGTFTAAGVDLDTATSSIKGIANLAALSGSNAQQASTAMYQLSQAIASGKVGLQDWKSVENASIGGKIFQTALVKTAEHMGTIQKGAVSVEGPMKRLSINGGSFRDSIAAKPGTQSWLTSDVLTNTLSQLSGDLSTADLKAQGYTKNQIKSIQAMAKTGVEAATKVKTLSQLMDTLKEAVGSGWGKTFQLIFGDFGQAKVLFTGVSNYFGKMISNSAKARNGLLKSFNEMGGRTEVIETIKQAFEGILSILKPITAAFREIFPPTTAKQLISIVDSLENFALNLSITGKTADRIKRTFAGVFAVLDIGWQVVKGVFSVIGDLFSSAASGSGGFLKLTATIGDFLVNLDKSIKKGEGLTKFFDGLGSILSVPIKILSVLAGLIGSLFEGFSEDGPKKVGDAFGRVGQRLSPVMKLFELFGQGLQNAGKYLEDLSPKIAKAFGGIADAINGSLSSGDFSGMLDVINTGLLGGILLLVRKFFKGGGKFGLDIGVGFTGSISSAFTQLTSTMKSMQTQIQAKTLMLIASAIGILTLSVVALSLIDSKALSKALSAMAVGFGQLLGAMAILTKVTASAGFVKMPLIGAALVLLSTSILILAAAVKILSTMSWEELTKGLGAVGLLLGALVAAAGPLSDASGGILRAGLAMIPLSISLVILAGAVKLFATMSWGELAKGLVGVAGALIVIAAAMLFMPKSLPSTAAGLVLVGFALGEIAGAMKLFATMSWEEMGKGLVGVAGALVAIAAAMLFMPPNLPITAAGLILVGIALGEIAGVAKIFASMSWEELGKAAAAMAGALLIISGGLYLMTGTLAGSAALIVAAGALAILTPVIVTLGALSWENIVKGLTAIAGVFVVLGVAGLLLGPIVPAIVSLGYGLVLVGAGMALAGVGALAFATAFAIFAAAGTAGLAVIAGIIKTIPQFMTSFAQGIVDFAKTIGKNAVVFGKAFEDLLDSLLNAVIKIAPKIGKAFNTLIDTALGVLHKNVGPIANAGLDLIQALLQAIDNHVSDITGIVVDIIVKFINAVGDGVPKIVDAGVQLVIKFINGITNALNAHSEELGRASGKLGVAIIKGMVVGVRGAAGELATAAIDAVKSALNKAKSFLHINSPSKVFRDQVGKPITEGMAAGVDDNASMVADSAVGALKSALGAAAKASEKSDFPKRFEDVAHFMGHAFYKGLVGGHDDVKAAFADLKTKLNDEMTQTEALVADRKAKLDDLLKTKGKDRDPEAIAKARKALQSAQDLNNAAQDAHDKLTKGLDKQKKQLLDLGDQYDKVTTKLKAAQQKLADAQAAKESQRQAVTSEFDVKPDIAADETLADYMTAANAQAVATVKFNQTLQALKANGLSDASYQSLLDQGLDAQGIMDQLLAGAGSGAITNFNTVNDAIAANAKDLGDKAAADMNDAGIAAAQGLVDGLLKKQGKIRDAMEAIAKEMIKAIKKELKIKSPSREFAEVGKFSALGVAQGLGAYSGVVEKASANLGNNALDTIKMSLSKVGTDISGNLNMNPVVAPVLDLTQLSKDATRMSSILQAQPLNADMTLRQAQSISNESDGAISSAADYAHSHPVTNVNFNQTNTSPKTLGAVEIYRQTRNQISLAKEALKVL